MTLSDAHAWLKGLHVASALLFVGGLVAETAFMASPGGRGAYPGPAPRGVGFRAWDQRLTTPAMLLVWGLGLTLALSQGWFSSHWLQVKLVFVLALSALHGVQSGALRRLAGGGGRVRKQTVPTLVIVISVVSIAVLAVVKPF